MSNIAPILLYGPASVVAAGTAINFAWRKAVRPVVRGMAVMTDAVPVLISIAEQFKPNHGTSLYDIVQSLTDRQIEAVKERSALKADVAVLATNQETLGTYVHDRFHTLDGTLGVLTGSVVELALTLRGQGAESREEFLARMKSESLTRRGTGQAPIQQGDTT